MFGMSRMLELFLQMNKRPRGLNQSLEEVCVLGFRLEPEMLQHIVCFVISLLIPALEESQIKRIVRNGGRGDRLSLQLAD